MSPLGPSRHFALPHDVGRKRSIAEVDRQQSIAEGELVTRMDSIRATDNLIRGLKTLPYADRIRE